MPNYINFIISEHITLSILTRHFLHSTYHVEISYHTLLTPQIRAQESFITPRLISNDTSEVAFTSSGLMYFSTLRSQQSLEKNVCRDFPAFSRTCILCFLTICLLIFFFSIPVPCSAFHFSMLSEVSLINFLR